MVKSIFLVIFLFALWTMTNVQNSEASGFERFKNKAKEIFSFGGQVSSGIVNKATDLIPNADNLFSIPKQAILGLPFELVITGIDKICSIVLSSSSKVTPFKQPKLEEINYVLLIDEVTNISVPITDSYQLWSHSQFNTRKNVVIVITGWNSNIEEENSAAQELFQAYESRKDSNFILIDTAKFVDTLYAWSAFNTVEIGRGIGVGLASLIEFIPIENIHLIGHSLGAHIAGAAGRRFEELTGQLLTRITGLDAAKPCFREGEILNGLGRGDAEFVDVIHSDSGGLGKADPMGDVDFYPNGIVPLMPGCMTIFCSHSRAWEYYAETVRRGNENNFIAQKCGTLHSYETKACVNKEISMGFACPQNAKGNFFLKTNSEFPFGRNAKIVKKFKL